MMDHTCSYYCKHPECIRAQRDYLRDRLEKVDKGGAVAWMKKNDFNEDICITDYELRVKQNDFVRNIWKDAIPLYTHPHDPALAKRLLADAKYHKSVYVQFMHEEDFKRMENCREAAAALGGGK